MPLRRQKHILRTDGLVAHRGGGDVEDTCRTYYRTFVHIQSIGRYDSIGATCHRESDKKCTVGDFVSSIVLGHLPRAEAESHRLSSVPRPLFSSTSFSSLHITKGTCSPWQRVNSATAPASVYDRSLCPHICCLLYTSPSPRDATLSRMPSSA